jgi:hypothetical protein
MMFQDTDLSPAVRELLKFTGPTELLRIASLPEAERLSGLSDDSLRRHHADRLIELGPRRIGMRVIDALMIKRSSKAGKSANQIKKDSEPPSAA